MLWNLGRKRKGDPFVWVKYEYLFSKTYPSHPLGRFPFFWDVWSSKKLITVSSLVLWIRCIICRSLFFVFPFPNHPPPTTQKIPPVSMCLYNPRWIPSIPSSQVPTLRLVLSTPLGCCNLPLLLSLSAANRSHRWQLSCRPPWRASEVVEVATWKPVYFWKTQAWGGFWHFKKKWWYFFFWLVPCFQNASEKVGAWKIWCKCVKSSMDSNVSNAPKTSCLAFVLPPMFSGSQGKNIPRRFGKKSLRIQNGRKNRCRVTNLKFHTCRWPHCTATKTTMG